MTTEASVLVRRLLVWMGTTPDPRGETRPPDADLARGLEEQLFSTALDVSERAIVARFRASESGELRDRFVESRVELALRNALGRLHAPLAPPPTPKVVAERGDGDRLLVLRPGSEGSSGTPSTGASPATRAVARIELRGVEACLHRLDSILEGAPLVDTSVRTIGHKAQADPVSIVGALLGKKYLLTRCLGVGGFGSVYEGRDLQLDKAVAIKILNHDRSRDPAELRAFKEEARRVTRLRHPHIVEWKTFDEAEDGTCYFVMELLKGRSLREVMDQEGRFEPERVLLFLEQILAALRSAHESDEGDPILHLDLKPQNILIVDDPSGGGREFVKLIDFGAGRLRGVGEEPVAFGGSLVDMGAATVEASKVTSTIASASAKQGADRVSLATACTPEYAAPELCAHLLDGPVVPLDGRADVYSVGVLGFELLTGELPIKPPSDRHALLRIKQDLDLAKVAVLAPRVPKALARFLDRCLSRRREERHASAHAALQAVQGIRRWRQRRRALLVLAPLAALGSLALWWLLPGGAPLPLSLVRVEADTSRPLEERLVLAPGHARVLLRIDGLEPAEPLTSVSLVAESTRAAEPLAGTSFTRRDELHVLQVSRPESRLETAAYVRVEAASGPPRFSQPFQLVWLGPGTFEDLRLTLPGDARHALDPSGAAASLLVSARAEDVASARVGVAERWIEASADPASSTAEETVFVAPLEGLFEVTGAHELQAEVVDRAGRKLDSTRAVQVVLESVGIRSAELDCLEVGNVYSLAPGRPVTLALDLACPADVSWRLLGSDGGVLARGEAAGHLSGPLALGDLSAVQGGRSFSGSLHILAEDAGSVTRLAPLRGQASRRVALEFVGGAPSLHAELRADDRAPFELTVGPHFLACDSLRLRVQRTSEHPLEVRARLSALDSPDAPVQCEAELVDPAQLVEEFSFATLREGAYDLEVGAWPSGGRPGESDGAPTDIRLLSRLIVDRSPDVLRVEGLETPFVVRSLDAPQRVTLESARGAASHVAPLDLVSRSRRVQPLGPWIAEQSLPDSGAPIEVELPVALAPAGAPLPDGAYELVIEGADRSGNSVAPVHVPFVIAARGPEIRWDEPPLGPTWRLTADNRLLVSARVEDSNGVEAASVRARMDGIDSELELIAEPDSVGENVGWRGELAIPPEWLGRSLELELRARDRFGAETLARAQAELVQVETSLPEGVAAAFRAHPVTAMRLVRGNADSPYLFGGRSDEEENRLFAAAGLPPFNDLSLTRSWAIEYAAGAIGDFYLDEHEVTAAQFHAFVSDAQAWHRSDLWNDDGPPPEERRLELVASLALRSGTLPVTGIRWCEARAYATWIGKRLPSLVEWELALRGGTRYRPHALGEGTLPPYSDERIPSGTGLDRTDSGLFGLSTNVAEWTSTPFLPKENARCSLERHLRQHAPELLHPWRLAAHADEAEYWVAGDPRLGLDFAAIERAPRERVDDALGFRCALGAEQVLDALRAPERGDLQLALLHR